MKTRFLIAAIALSLSMAASARGQTNVPAAYFDGAVKEMPVKKPGKLAVDDAGEALEFTWDKGSWKVPYTQLKTIYLSLSRHSDLGSLFGLGGYAVGRLKKRKLLLSLILTDEQGLNRRCVFFLPEAAPPKFFEIIEKKSGRSVIYESEEARRAVEDTNEKTSGGRISRGKSFITAVI
jgi:hypothetical protein